ncbi:MAG: AIR synthase-related protein [Chitinophagales bacterium]
MVGRMEDLGLKTGLGFKESGHVVYLLGKSQNDLAASEYLANVVGIKASPAPYFNMDEEKLLLKAIYQLIRKGILASCHDVADGGLVTSLLESAYVSNIGFEISTDRSIRKDSFLFGEAQGRAIVSIIPDHSSELESFCTSMNLSFSKLGEVKGSNVVIDGIDFGTVEGYKTIHLNSIHDRLAS